MGDFLTVVAENAALITVVGLGWCALSFTAALLLGKAIKRGMLGSVDEFEGADENIIHPSDE